ncbi:MAG: asparagine--tRNA ligase, partial [Bacteroidales bacterium]|nr:asparagine--tRNA ligase [Bacteroidales bacterium]
MAKLRIYNILNETDTIGIGNQVKIQGWVRTRRGNNAVAFIALNDGSCIHNLQVVADLNHFDEAILKKVTTGACIEVNGKLVESMGKGQTVEIQAEQIKLLGEADP